MCPSQHSPCLECRGKKTHESLGQKEDIPTFDNTGGKKRATSKILREGICALLAISIKEKTKSGCEVHLISQVQVEGFLRLE